MADAASRSRRPWGIRLKALAASSGRAARREPGTGGRAETLALGSASSVSVSICWGCPGLDWVGGPPNLRRSIRRYPADFIEPAQIAVHRRASKPKRPRRTALNRFIFLKKTGAGEGIRTLDPNLGKVLEGSTLGYPKPSLSTIIPYFQLVKVEYPAPGYPAFAYIAAHSAYILLTFCGRRDNVSRRRGGHGQADKTGC